MRSTIIATIMLILGSPALAQPSQIGKPEIMQKRIVDPVQPRTDTSVTNPTNMQLRVEIDELSAKVDDLTSLIQAQSNAIATISGNLSSIKELMTQFRQVSDEQYKNCA